MCIFFGFGVSGNDWRLWLWCGAVYLSEICLGVSLARSSMFRFFRINLHLSLESNLTTCNETMTPPSRALPAK